MHSITHTIKQARMQPSTHASDHAINPTTAQSIKHAFTQSRMQSSMHTIKQSILQSHQQPIMHSMKQTSEDAFLQSSNHANTQSCNHAGKQERMQSFTQSNNQPINHTMFPCAPLLPKEPRAPTHMVVSYGPLALPLRANNEIEQQLSVRAAFPPPYLNSRRALHTASCSPSTPPRDHDIQHICVAQFLHETRNEIKQNMSVGLALPHHCLNSRRNMSMVSCIPSPPFNDHAIEQLGTYDLIGVRFLSMQPI
jgi:hypothetical protein